LLFVAFIVLYLIYTFHGIGFANSA
jgi:hypothetical protein